MDGGITRQSEQYGIFEDRPRPERVAREAPQEVIREYTRGRSVGAGQLNPRNIRRHHFAEMTEQGPGVGAGLTYPAAGVAGTPADAALANGPGEAALESSMKADLASGGTYPGDPGTLDITGKRRQAVDTRGMDPESHAYAGEVPYGPTGIGRERRHYNPYAGYEPTDRDEAASEAVWEDDESGFNWGPEPHHDPGSEPGMGTPLQPLDEMLEHLNRPDPRPPSFSAARHLADDGPAPAPVAAPLFTHMFTVGQRVGLPYGNDVIPGIVHQLHPTSEVGVRWGDGQYTTESPGDIQPL